MSHKPGRNLKPQEQSIKSSSIKIHKSSFHSVKNLDKVKSTKDKLKKLEKPSSETELEIPDFEADMKAKALTIFQQFDKFEDGKVDSKHLETMLHLLNQAVTREQLHQLETLLQDKYPDQELGDIRMKFDDFYELVDEIFEPMSQLRRRLKVALQILDTKHDGLMDKLDLSAQLTQFGDVLNEFEIREFMKIWPTSKDTLPIDVIVDTLCSNGRAKKKQTDKSKQKKT